MNDDIVFIVRFIFFFVVGVFQLICMYQFNINLDSFIPINGKMYCRKKTKREKIKKRQKQKSKQARNK